jgi:hypothetical protein
MRLPYKLLAAVMLCIAIGGIASAQFGPRAAPGFAAPTILTADEIHLRSPGGGLWRVTVTPRGALVATPVRSRPLGWPGGGKRW